MNNLNKPLVYEYFCSVEHRTRSPQLAARVDLLFHFMFTNCCTANGIEWWLNDMLNCIDATALKF